MTSHQSMMMPNVAISVTESELFSATKCAQNMLFEKKGIESMALKVKTPMKLFVDNRGEYDLLNSWKVGGRTRHIEVKQYFIRELKERGLIEVVWIPTDQMTADIFTKNLPKNLFEKHASVFVGVDEYMN